MSQQRIPDTLGDVGRIQRRAVPGAEDVIDLPGHLVLCLQRIDHQRPHGDLALRTVGLGVVGPALVNGLTNQDLAGVEVDASPFQAVDLAGAHAGKETHRVVMAKVAPDGVQDQANLGQGERVNILALEPQALDVLNGVAELEPVGRFGHHHTQHAHDVIDSLGREGRVANPPRLLRELGPGREYVGLGDVRDRPITKLGQDMSIQRGRVSTARMMTPTDLVLSPPGFYEVLEERRCRLSNIAEVCWQFIELESALAVRKVLSIFECEVGDLFELESD